MNRSVNIEAGDWVKYNARTVDDMVGEVTRVSIDRESGFTHFIVNTWPVFPRQIIEVRKPAR